MVTINDIFSHAVVLEDGTRADYPVSRKKSKGLPPSDNLPTTSEGFYTDEPGQVFQHGNRIQEITPGIRG